MQIERIGVVGGGIMGSGIAQVSAQAGFPTTVRDLDDQALQRSRSLVTRSLDRAVEKGKATLAGRDSTLANLTFAADPESLRDCDLVVEAVSEDLAVKRDLWRSLDAIVKPDAIFATNTSSLSVAEQAAATARPAQFVGLHFFNPVPAMRLVEIVRALTTSEETMRAARDFVHSIGKESIIAPDRPGF